MSSSENHHPETDHDSVGAADPVAAIGAPAAPAPASAAATDSAPSSHDSAAATGAAGTPSTATAPAERFGIGPFSIREIVLFGFSALLLISTFLPQFIVHVMGIGANIWINLWSSIGLLALLGILPMVFASGLIVARRLVPARRWRVGSLSVDQFASAMAITTIVFYLVLWAGTNTINSRFAIAGFGGGVVIQLAFGYLLSFFAALGILLTTTFGPYLPIFAEDFRDRREESAAPIAREAVAVTRRPRPVAPVPSPVAGPYAPAATGAQPVATAPSPFWVHSTYQRSVVDRTTGALLFEIGPSAWALAVEDLGSALIIRHEDGRVGILREINGLTRG